MTLHHIALASAALLIALSSCQRGGSGIGADDQGSGPPGTGTSAVTDDGAIQLLCQPGEVQCDGQAFLATCAPTGLEWLPEPCPNNASCVECDGETCAVDHCAGPCESDALVPSSAGCSFIANRQLHLSEDFGDTAIVANPNSDLVATIKWWRTPEGKRKEELVEMLTLMPGEDHVFEMTTDFVLGTSSMFRTGGIYRIESDAPVIAYQHAPGRNYRGNDSSLLLPDSIAAKDYVIASYSPNAIIGNEGKPSYFEIVALEDYTTVEWTPRVPTSGNGLPIEACAAGETCSQSMNRFDTMRIAASENFPEEYPGIAQDVSGTVVHADKPIWVVGGSRCSRVPVREAPALGFCDPLQEVMIPLDYWGSNYVAAHPPLRGNELHYWRVYGGPVDGVTITTEPPVLTADNCPAPNVFSDGTCQIVSRGGFIEVEVPNGLNFIVDGDGAFLVVGYLQSKRSGSEPGETATDWGDPAMYQLVPTEQFLDRYVVRTAIGYPHNYVQIVRPIGGPNVIVDSDVIQAGAWEQVGNFEVANHEVTEGAHTIFSDEPFGVSQIGFTEEGDQDYEGCTNIPNPPCMEGCPPITDAMECESFLTNDLCCTWTGEECVPARKCRSSYAYPGGMRSQQIYIP